MAARQTDAAVDNEASTAPENIIIMRLLKQFGNSFNRPRTRSGYGQIFNAFHDMNVQ